MSDNYSNKCKIDQNEQLGRYVKAIEPIKSGETLLLEKPILILAGSDEKRCWNCFKFAQSFCSKCLITPLCLECSQHDAYDCQTISNLQIENKEDFRKYPSACSMLKCLLLHENAETQQYFDAILKLESHLEKRRNTPIWKEHNEQIVAPILKSNLQQSLKLKDQINEEFLQKLCGILDVNTYEIRAPEQGTSMKALYLNGSLIASDCIPNINVAIDVEYRLKVYANRDIENEEIVTNCYTNVLLGTEERRHILQVGKYFTCHCARCEDPTEIGSHMSSFICAPCAANNREGYLVRNAEAKLWKCSKCSHSLRFQNIENILDKTREEIFHAQGDIRRYEILLAKLSTILHRNHYLMIDIKQNIANLLRSIIVNSVHRPGRRVYERKVRLCQELVMLLHTIQPGISRLKAIALYELANSSAEWYRLRFNEKELTDAELLGYLQQCESMLKESMRMLVYEPTQTPEGHLFKELIKELKDLQNDMELVKKAAEK